MIKAVCYGPDGVEARPIEDADDVRAARDAAATTWIRATEATDEELNLLQDALELHYLTIEDVRHDVRPKVEEFEEYTFLVVRDAELRRGEQVFSEEIDDEALGILIGGDWLVTMATGPVPAVDEVWDAVGRGESRLLARGADFAAYRVLDVLVGDYFDILDRIETEIEDIEEAVVTTTDIELLEAINGVRRDLLAFRKLAWPAREAVNVLARGDPEFVREGTEKYFRDVSDQLVQVVDLIETYRDLTNGTRDIYLNTLSQSTNEVMKALTVVATIFIPLTFVVGVYGMNFAFSESTPLNMPELTWTYGYPAVMLGMALVVIILVLYFRQQDWV
jgi:magnesium transporter